MTTKLSRKAERHERAKKQFDEISKVLETKSCYRIRGTSMGELLLILLNGHRVRYVVSQCNHTCGKKCRTRKCLCRCPDYPFQYSPELCNCHNGWLCSHKCEDLVCSFGSWILIDKI
jgi:hypothetical protein